MATINGAGDLRVNVSDMDCTQIFTCGQCFRWKPDGEWWKGVARGRLMRVRTDAEAGTLIIKDCSRDEFDAVWRDYFDLGTDYGEIKSYLASLDPHLADAVRFGGGIRLLRQEPFETLISFIISANNNIPRISGCVEALCARYGERAGNDPVTGETVYAFPAPEALAAATPEDVSEACHAGYRSPYIVSAAKRFIATGGDLSDPESYMGVGPKVASCIRLFTGSDMNAFPVDVWVKRLIKELYFPPDAEPGMKEIADFIAGHFPKYGGYAQQYLFFRRREAGNGAV